MRLLVKRRYRNRELFYLPGEIVVGDALGEWLLRDAPGTFERVGPSVTALDAPPADKMVRRARKK